MAALIAISPIAFALNPKVVLFFLAFLPQFTRSQGELPVFGVLVLALAADAAFCLAANAIGPWLNRTSNGHCWFASIYLGLGLFTALSSARQLRNSEHHTQRRRPGQNRSRALPVRKPSDDERRPLEHHHRRSPRDRNQHQRAHSDRSQRKRNIANAFAWIEITQGEHRFAPQRHAPGVKPGTTADPDLAIDRAWWRLRTGKAGQHYWDLRAALTPRLNQLAAAIVCQRSIVGPPVGVGDWSLGFEEA